MLPLRTAGLLVATVLVVAACGDDSSTSKATTAPVSTAASAVTSAATTSAAASTAAPTAGPTTTAGAATASSSSGPRATAGSFPTVRDYTFPPLTASPGGTVTVMNADDDAHTITADGGAFSVGLPANGTASFTAPTTPGSYTFHCNVHSTMTGTLVVA
jgi:plastocyanin